MTFGNSIESMVCGIDGPAKTLDRKIAVHGSKTDSSAGGIER
jgi:hypothetical protein